MKEILQIQTPFKMEPDDKIIIGLQSASDQSEIKFFQYEFYNRFAGYIYKAGLHHFKLYNGTQFLATELLQETFIKAFAKIGNFKFPSKAEPSDYSKILKAWLGKIALNESRKVIGKSLMIK